MDHLVINTADTGLEVFDLHEEAAFAQRHLHTRDVALQIEGMRRLSRAFVENPDTLLQQLVNVAVDLCGADSAGISMELEDKTETEFYRWIATAGQYTQFMNATLPRQPSACTMCLERGRPQLFRVTQRFFDLMGITAPTVTDGILLPWEVNEMRGTIWIMAHGRTEAFDQDDVHMMQVLADFVAIAMRHRRQQQILMDQAAATAVAAISNELAHQINNPLQSLTNLVYLAGDDKSAKNLAEDLSEHIVRLSALVSKLLALPDSAIRSK